MFDHTVLQQESLQDNTSYSASNEKKDGSREDRVDTHRSATSLVWNLGTHPVSILPSFREA